MRFSQHTGRWAAALLMTAAGLPVAAYAATSHPRPERPRTAQAAEAAACARHVEDVTDPPTIVLVHGAAAESSSWHDVIVRLQQQGYPVVAYANPLRSLAGDVAGLRELLATIDGPVVLVGHSYGGMVISVAATGNDHVRSLVYVDAHVPLPGETAAELTNKFGGSEFGSAILTRPFTMPDGTTGTDIYVDPAKYRWLFTGQEVSAREAAVLAAVQRPISASALNEPAASAAWQHLPSWDVIGTEDIAIPPASQRFMAERAGAQVTEVPAAHVSMLTFPCTIAKVIGRAAR